MKAHVSLLAARVAQALWLQLDTDTFRYLDLSRLGDVGRAGQLVQELVQAGVLLRSETGRFMRGNGHLAVYQGSPLGQQPIGFQSIDQLLGLPVPPEPEPALRIAPPPAIVQIDQLPDGEPVVINDRGAIDLPPGVELARVSPNVARVAKRVWPLLDGAMFRALDRPPIYGAMHMSEASFASAIRTLVNLGVLQQFGERRSATYRQGSPWIAVYITTTSEAASEVIDLSDQLVEA